MSLRDRLEESKIHFCAIMAVVSCRDSLHFADLCWPPFDWEDELQRVIEGRDPGVIFETATRVVVIEEHSGELRYYAGGWRSHESRILLEQERIWGEGYELGIFLTPRDAVLFAERFLVRAQALQDIEAPRQVHQRQETDKSREPGASPDPGGIPDL